jgi:hypothetical protein
MLLVIGQITPMQGTLGHGMGFFGPCLFRQHDQKGRIWTIGNIFLINIKPPYNKKQTRFLIKVFTQ